jgi:UDPglucose--hexose-1-phosphate uridylyltransferase
MKFYKIKKEARFLDPFNNFKERICECEIREDPLTGRRTRIFHFPVREMQKPDLDPIIAKSKKFCPFCPEMAEKITPKFIPELFKKDRYRVGKAICFPNAFPYDENGAVIVMTDRHFVSIGDFNHEILSDAISCCVEFFNDVSEGQPEAVYQSINWNYLPPAGSSIIHPHLQTTASTSPTNYYNDVLRSVEKYKRRDKGNIFVDLIENERKLDERFISETERIAWLASFSPMGVFDIIGIFKKHIKPSDLSGETLNEIIDGILHTLNYINSLNMYSFNMSIFFLLHNEKFAPHMRICPRVSIPPNDTSEVNYMKMLHNEPMTIIKPEDVTSNIKKIWQ